MRCDLRFAMVGVAALLAAQLATPATAQVINQARQRTIYGRVGGVQATNGAGLLYVTTVNNRHGFNANMAAVRMAANLGGLNFGGGNGNMLAGNLAGGNLVGVNPAAANMVGAAALRRGQMFQIGPQTRFFARQGSLQVPVNVASLRPGTRVAVRAIGQQAAVVQVLPQQRYVVSAPIRRGGSRPPKTLGRVHSRSKSHVSPAAEQQRTAARQAKRALHAQQVANRMQAKKK